MAPVRSLRRLLATALLDASNHRFLTVCRRCVPLHNFSFLHSYLLPPLPAGTRTPSPSTATTSSGGSALGSVNPHAVEEPAPALASRDGVWQGEGAAGMRRRSFLPFNDAAGHGGRDRFNPSCFLPLMKVRGGVTCVCVCAGKEGWGGRRVAWRSLMDRVMGGWGDRMM